MIHRVFGMKKFLLFLLFSLNIYPQNLDLLFIYNSGFNKSMGGTGIAAAGDNAAFDLNPALLSNSHENEFTVSQNFKFYDYNLVRISSQVGGTTWDWDNSKINFERASFIYRPGDKVHLGIGVFQKIDPQFVNKKWAVTFSDLFFQETKGNIYSFVLSGAYNINDNLIAGLSFYRYFGSIKSRVTGDNHGNDLDKWAYLKSSLSGFNFRGGLLFKGKKWRAGLVIETPFNMTVNASKEASADHYFKYLLPSYDKTDWKFPWIIAAGFSYKINENLQIEVDAESRRFTSSDARFNLYELGGDPVYSTVNIFRAGFQLCPDNSPVPIRAGYAYIPQFYYSNISTGLSNTITAYQNTDRNIRHVFSAGTSFNINIFAFNITLEYSVLKWHRKLTAPQTITDEYSGNYIRLSSDISLPL